MKIAEYAGFTLHHLINAGPPKYMFNSHETSEDAPVATSLTTSHKLMEQPTNRSGKYDKNINRYNLQFTQESKKELDAMKEDGFKPLNVMTPKEREMDASYFEGFDFPVRPPWSFDSTKEQLDRNENRYFKVIQVRQKNFICVVQY